MKVLRVGLDVPIDTLFDYRCEDAGPADVGCRVLVPFGRRTVVGVAVAVADTSEVPSGQLKHVTRVLRSEPGVASEDLRLIGFAASYYHHPLGTSVMSTLPQRLRRTKAPQAATPSCYRLTSAGERAAPEDLPPRSAVQRRLFSAFKQERVLDAAAIRAAAPSGRAALRQLLARGWVEAMPTSDAPKTPLTGPHLRDEQAAAVEAITEALGSFRPFLLHGITGSGKTEVYLHAIKNALDRGLQALLLVPEIALTPQLEAALRDRLPGSGLVSLHSGLNEGERANHWLAAHSGAAGIVLGTRLAVFAPLPRLGLIIVDEEHDASFKQMDGLRYSARDLAVVRAHQRSVPVVLGSATPALETHYNARTGRYRLLELTKRIHAAPPLISCINTRHHRPIDGLSAPFLEALRTRLARGEQTLVFINRRGYAPVLMCGSCGWLSSCHRCTAKLVLHLRDRRLRCHHCGHELRIPPVCPDCGNADLAPIGQGTQRVESALAAQFPGARIVRVDRDSTRRRNAWHAMRDQIRAREVDILVGTQILAKGHDFPHLNLVGVLNADSLLYSTDFRAAERLFALLTQVSGRAGRGMERGEVLVQTDFPEHPLYAALRSQDYRAFAEAQLAERRVAGFPPFVHQVLLRAESSDMASALDFLTEAARAGRALDHSVAIYDPVPATMARRAGRERAQLLVQAQDRGALQQFLGPWRRALAGADRRRVRWALDVDPLEF